MSQENESATGRIARAVAQRLTSLHKAGVTHLPRAAARASPANPLAARQAPAANPGDDRGGGHPPSMTSAGDGAQGPAADVALARSDRTAALAAVARRVAACTRCAELARSRTQIVFGVGNPHARLVFLGEAPGADEDRQGEPFVGAAGQLLTDIITKGMKLRREDVYIMNILRCRPPGNRTPLPVEAAACREYLVAQLAIIQPEFICCLGACAAQNLLGTTTPIGRLRGRFHEHEGTKVLCTYHPAYLLHCAKDERRYREEKRKVWDDIQLLMAEMGLAK